ncbi:unnamed protein product [Protopolystoma xenopodis]|uniref:Axin beta-catenin binding domain-containing protein n=1 Tax=Protopolystoma xenopodis TaxID=117903 RepID=A0A3S4ZTI3_9PLAT|nr:unnamed protein product [Protopolystoma xenopodis]
MPKRSLSNSVPSFSATSSELPVHLYSSITSSLEPTSNLLLKTQDNNSLIGVRDGNNGSTADSSCCRSQMTSTNPCGGYFITNDIEGCKNGEVIRTSGTSVGDGNVDCSIFSRDANHAYRGVSKSRSKQPKETVKEHWNLAETNPNEFVRLLSARLEKLKESRHKMESLLSRVSQEAKLPPSDTRSGNTLSTDPSWSMEPGRMPLRYRAGHYDRSCEPKLLQPPRAMTVEDHCAKHIGKYERRGRRRGAGENELYRTRQAPSSAYASLSPASSSRFATSRSSCCDSLTTSTFPSSTPPFGTNVLDIPAIPSNPVSTGSIPISPFPKSHLNWCPSRCCRSHPRTLRPRNHHRHRHNRPSARSSGPPSHGHSMSASAVTPGTVAIEDGCSCKCDLSGESCLLQREDRC